MTEQEVKTTGPLGDLVRQEAARLSVPVSELLKLERFTNKCAGEPVVKWSHIEKLIGSK